MSRKNKRKQNIQSEQEKSVSEVFQPEESAAQSEIVPPLTSEDRKINLGEKLLFGNNNKEEKAPVEEIVGEVVMPEETVPEKPGMGAKQLEKRSKRRLFAVMGVILFVLAVVGAVTTVMFVSGGVLDLVNKTSQKEKFQNIVYPLVIVDVPEFDTIGKLDSKVIISAGVWQFIMHQENKDKYPKDEFGTMLVPAVDIEPYIRQLFGTHVTIQHQQLPNTEFYVPYDEETQSYYIANHPQILPYSPKVLSVDHKGREYTVKVGYILPGPFWNLQENLKPIEINKTMIYTFKKVGDDYNVVSVKQFKEGDKEASSIVSGITSDVSGADQTSHTSSAPESSAVESSPENAPPVQGEPPVAESTPAEGGIPAEGDTPPAEGEPAA